MRTLTGLAIGDALGMPWEMHSRFGGALLGWDGTFQSGITNTLCPHLKAGQWTDDTKMAMALARSLVANDEYVYGNVAQQYLAWYESGDLRGIGTATDKALRNMQRSNPVTGVLGAEGNGTAMRVAPIGAFYRNDILTAIKFAREDAVITHNSLEAQEGSVAVTVGVASLLKGLSKRDTLLAVIGSLRPSKVRRGLEQVAKMASPDDPLDTLVELGTGAHVVKTVPAAFFCLLATTSFKDAVTVAIRAGGDTDTTAAVTGALAGSFYDPKEIEPYLGQLEDAAKLVGLDQGLIQRT
jgi:ADP-ribosyl-[dinitrogen reductase] hydrolase